MQKRRRAPFDDLGGLRTLHPDVPMYTFWDYKRNRWQRDAGLRLDHLLLNAKAAKRLVDAGVDREVRGLEGASDHAPAWIVLRDTPATGRKTARRSEKRTRPKSGRSTLAPLPRQPLLVIDGDSFAHRSYPILGFANMLLRLYRGERPRAVLVAWDTLEAPTYRHENFPAYQSGREFDDAVVEQLDVLPEFALPAASRMRKRRVSRRMIFSPPLPPKKKGEGALSSLRAATATHFSLPPTAPPSSTPSAPARWRVSAPPRFVRGMASTPSRFRILSPCAAIPPTRCRAHRALARLVLRRCCKDTAASKPR